MKYQTLPITLGIAVSAMSFSLSAAAGGTQAVYEVQNELISPGYSLDTQPIDQLQSFLPISMKASIRNNFVTRISLVKGDAITKFSSDNPALKQLISEDSYYAQLTALNDKNKYRTLFIKYDRSNAHLVSQCMNSARHSLVQRNTEYAIRLLDFHLEGGGSEDGFVEIMGYQISDKNINAKEYPGNVFLATEILNCTNYRNHQLPG